MVQCDLASVSNDIFSFNIKLTGSLTYGGVFLCVHKTNNSQINSMSQKRFLNTYLAGVHDSRRMS